MAFEKPATGYNEQIEILQRRGLVVEDKSLAKHYLMLKQRKPRNDIARTYLFHVFRVFRGSPFLHRQPALIR